MRHRISLSQCSHMDMMVCRSTHPFLLVQHRPHTHQANATLINPRGRSLQAYQERISNTGRSTHILPILSMLLSTPTRLRKLASCYHRSKCLLKTHRAFILNRPQHRITLRYRHPSVIDNIRRLVGRMHRLQAPADQACRLCIRSLLRPNMLIPRRTTHGLRKVLWVRLFQPRASGRRRASLEPRLRAHAPRLKQSMISSR
jgi:hypothetical protein